MKAIRLHIKQNFANYRKEETVNNRMTYPLPPYSTVIGALHKACGYTEYHPMQLSIQGNYESLKTKLFKEDCFLNSLQDDRGILVKMQNPDMLSSAYQVVARAQKGQGNSFEKGITINVENQQLIAEYRALKRYDDSRYKNLINAQKDKLKSMKKNPEFSKQDIKKFSDRLKAVENKCKSIKEKRYTIPFSKYKTLTKAPKRYEILYGIEMIIHVVSDEKTMNDIMENIVNITAIGRSEDFIEVLDCVFTNIKETTDIIKGTKYPAYIPVDTIEKNEKNLYIKQVGDEVRTGGTKYWLNKDYTVENLKGGYRKRVFNRVPVLYTSTYRVKAGCVGIYVDHAENIDYPVFLA